MIGYNNEIERVKKNRVQEELFDSFSGRKFKNVLMFPSTTMNDLKLGFQKEIFDKDTKFLFVEKGECYPFRHNENGLKESFEGFASNDKIMRKVFFVNELLEYEKEEKNFFVNNCVFHFDELYTMDLKYVLTKSGMNKLDFCYFDFCGGLPDKLMNWFRYNASYLNECELIFTHCIDNIARGNKKTYNKYGKVKPLSYYGIIGNERNIVKDNYEERYQNVTSFNSDAHIYNANNMILFYEKVFNKKYCDLIFYKDTEESFHKQKMCSFRLKSGDISEDIVDLEWEREVEKISTIFDNTNLYWKNNFYKLSHSFNKKQIDSYTYMTNEQFNRLKEILNKHIEMYDVNLFNVSKRRVFFDKEKEAKKDKVSLTLLREINKGIVKISCKEKRKELSELFNEKVKELEMIQEQIEKMLKIQNSKNKRICIEYLKSMSEEERKEFIESVSC